MYPVSALTGKWGGTVYTTQYYVYIYRLLGTVLSAGFHFQVHTQRYYYDKQMCNVTVVCASRISWWTDKTKPTFRSLSFADSTFSHFIMIFEWECDHHHQEKKTTATRHMHTWLNKSNICCCARTVLTHVHVYILKSNRKWYQYNMYTVVTGCVNTPNCGFHKNTKHSLSNNGSHGCNFYSVSARQVTFRRNTTYYHQLIVREDCH